MSQPHCSPLQGQRLCSASLGFNFAFICPFSFVKISNSDISMGFQFSLKGRRISRNHEGVPNLSVYLKKSKSTKNLVSIQSWY